MTIFETLKDDLTKSRLQHNNLKTVTLSHIVGDLMSKAILIDGEKIVKNDVAINYLKKYIKNCEESLSVCTSENISFQKRLAESYLPAQLTEDQINDIVAQLISDNVNTLPLIMKYFKENFSGLYNSQTVIDIIKEKT